MRDLRYPAGYAEEAAAAAAAIHHYYWCDRDFISYL
jgi:hypothetical protein